LSAVPNNASQTSAERALEAEYDFVPAVLDAIGSPVGIADRSGRMVRCNRAFERLAGYRFEEVRGRLFWEIFLPAEDAEFAKDFFAKLPRDGSPANIDATWVTRSGERRLIEWAITVVANDGEVAYVVASGLDVTERRQAEAALRQSEERFALAAVGSEQGLYDVNRCTGEAYFSPRALEVLGFPDSNAAADSFDDWQDRIHPDDRNLFNADLIAHLQGPSAHYESEYRLRCDDGAYRHVLARGLCLRDAEGWPYRFVGYLTDVTQSRQAEQMLRTSALVLENMAEGVNVVDERGVIAFTNPAFDAIFGYERGELIGQPVNVLNPGPPEEREGVAAEVLKRLRREGAYAGEFCNRKKDGAPFWSRARIRALALPGATCWISLQEDITEQRKIELTLRESEEKFRELVENINETMYVLDANGIATYVSPGGELVDGPVSEIVGHPFESFVHPDDLGALREHYRANREGRSGAVELRCVIQAGAIRRVRISSRAIFRDGRFAGIRGIASDLTKLRQAEDEARARQAELAHVLRVSTMGEMASGLAHEINQPLAAIVNYARGCTRRLQSDGQTSPSLLTALEKIAEEALRAGRVVHGVRKLVRKDAPRRAAADLNDLVHEAVQLMEPEARTRNVAIRVNATPEMPTVRVDQVQVEQVILNLLRNGIEAMGEQNGHTRELSVRTSIAGRESLAVSVSDTGEGLDPEIIEKMFDPFFTTKPDGLGMGLAISRSIIESHGGQLWAVANAGRGATFHFTLPLPGDRAGD